MKQKPVTADGRTTAKQQRQNHYLEALATGMRPTKAVVLAEVSMGAVRTWRKTDTEFVERENDAIREVVEDVEAVVFQSALEGNTNDARWWLKYHDPDRYSDTTKVHHTGGVVHELSGRRFAEELLALRQEVLSRAEMTAAELPPAPEIVYAERNDDPD